MFLEVNRLLYQNQPLEFVCWTSERKDQELFSLFQHNQHFKLITIIYKRAFNTPMMI